jgi:hypothetical protein
MLAARRSNHDQSVYQVSRPLDHTVPACKVACVLRKRGTGRTIVVLISMSSIGARRIDGYPPV